MQILKHLLRGALPGMLAVLAAGSTMADQRLFDDLRKRGDNRAVIAYIEGGGDVRIRDSDGFTLLDLAAAAGDMDLARRLLERDADVDADSGWFGRTPISQAVIANQPAMAKLLHDHGADMDVRDTSSNATLLHHAARLAGPDMVDFLLDAGLDPLAQAASPGRPLWMTPHDAARKFNPALLETDAGRRLARLTAEGTGCDGVFVLAGDTKLALMAERVLGDKTRWKEIAELNGLGPDKGYRKGDCLKMP